jgi:hypothetical protein
MRAMLWAGTVCSAEKRRAYDAKRTALRQGMACSCVLPDNSADVAGASGKRVVMFSGQQPEAHICRAGQISVGTDISPPCWSLQRQEAAGSGQRLCSCVFQAGKTLLASVREE